MSTSGTGNNVPSGISVDLTDLFSSSLPANSASESTNLLQPQVEAQPTPVELVSSSVAAVQPPMAAGGRGFGSRGSNSGSRKRGRPRKSALENANARDCLPVSEAQIHTSNDSLSAPPAATTPADFLPVPPLPPSSSARKPRGRPRGSGTKQPTHAPTAPMRARLNRRPAFITARDQEMHTIFVSKGEDLTAKLIAFAQQAAKNICIVSHYGSVSRATLRPPTSSTGSMTYEGCYKIISLSGSLIQSDQAGGERVWTGGFTVTLSGTDNHNVAGGVAGPLIAATPIQVILSSFTLPKEEEAEPGTVDPVNTTETGGPAAGGDVNESLGSDGGASTSILGNFGGDVNESVGVGVGGTSTDSFGVWKHVNNPDT